MSRLVDACEPIISRAWSVSDCLTGIEVNRRSFDAGADDHSRRLIEAMKHPDIGAAAHFAAAYGELGATVTASTRGSSSGR